MGDSEGFAYETGTVDSDFSDFVEGHCFDRGGIDGGVHGGKGVDFCWGDWFVFKTVCVDDVGGEHFGCGGDGGWDGVRHWEGSFLWIVGECRGKIIEKYNRDYILRVDRFCLKFYGKRIK